MNYPDFIILPYKTRLSDPGYFKKQLEIVEEIFENASKRHKFGVFLTLTTDPKRFKSVYHAWRHFSEAFNQFLSFVRKRKGFGLHYIAVYEFTKSGLLHVHVVFFGIGYLARKDDITKEWKRCNQGEINYVYKLVNRNGKWIGLKFEEEEKKNKEKEEDAKD